MLIQMRLEVEDERTTTAKCWKMKKTPLILYQCQVLEKRISQAEEPTRPLKVPRHLAQAYLQQGLLKEAQLKLFTIPHTRNRRWGGS